MELDINARLAPISTVHGIQTSFVYHVEQFVHLHMLRDGSKIDPYLGESVVTLFMSD